MARTTVLRLLAGAISAGAILLSVAVLHAAPVPVSAGPEIDAQPSLLLRRNGEFLVSFTRTTLRGGRIDNRDVFVTRSTDGGNSWFRPVPVFSARNAFEEAAEMIELSDGTVILFAASDETGISRIRMASSGDGDTWVPVAGPLDFGWPGTVPQRNPHAVANPNDSILLVYETSAPDAVAIAYSDTRGVLWDQIRSVVASGAAHPKLHPGPLGSLLATYEDPASQRALVEYCPGGPLWSEWTGNTFVTLDSGIENGTPLALPYWDGSYVVYGSILPPGSTSGRQIVRKFSPNGLDWSGPIEVLVDGPGDEGNPHVVIPGTGSFCMVWDETTWSGALPATGDIWIECGTDDRCSRPPLFDGLVDGLDADPCSYSGIGLAWQAPANWGSGTSGTYEVHRSEAPAFAPDASTLLAAGLVDTWFLDSSPQPGVAYSYIIRAVNDETCGSGRTGLTTDSDPASVRLADLAEPLPSGPVTDLRLARDPSTGGILFTWNAAPGAVATELWRSPDPRPGAGWAPSGGPYAGSSASLTEPRAAVFFYQARGLNDCGGAGPW